MQAILAPIRRHLEGTGKLRWVKSQQHGDQLAVVFNPPGASTYDKAAG